MAEGSDAYRLGEYGGAWLRYQSGQQAQQGEHMAVSPATFALVAHDLLIADFVVPLKRDIEQLGGAVNWRSALDIPDHECNRYVIPDAYLDVELAGMYSHYFVEIDRGVELPGQFAAKLLRYADYARAGNWAVLGYSYFPAVLVVTTGGRRRLGEVRREVAARATQIPDFTLNPWKFTSFARLEHELYYNALDSDIWQAADHDDYFCLMLYSEYIKVGLALLAELHTEQATDIHRIERRELEGEGERMAQLLARLKGRTTWLDTEGGSEAEQVGEDVPINESEAANEFGL